MEVNNDEPLTIEEVTGLYRAYQVAFDRLSQEILQYDDALLKIMSNDPEKYEEVLKAAVAFKISIQPIFKDFETGIESVKEMLENRGVI